MTDDTAAARSGIEHAGVLLAFADALVQGDVGALATARADVRRLLGDAALVDVAAVAANFERMVRIADGTGIPLDPPVHLLSEDLRADLGLGRFASAANTPAPGLLRAAMGPILRRLAGVVLRLRGA